MNSFSGRVTDIRCSCGNPVIAEYYRDGEGRPIRMDRCVGKRFWGEPQKNMKPCKPIKAVITEDEFNAKGA